MSVFNLALVIILVTVGTASGQHRIVLSLDKVTYLVDEAIWFEAIEQNLTVDTVLSSPFIPSALAYCEIILKDVAGKQWPYKGGIANIAYRPQYESLLSMAPGQERYLVKQLHGIFGEQDEYHDLMYYLPPGRYTLQVLLHTNYHWPIQNRELWRQYGPAAADMVDKGTIYSNEVSFRIVEPTGIEKDVHQKLLEAYKLDWEISQESTVYEQIYPIYQDIVENHPNSVYTINAYFAFHRHTAGLAGHRVDRRKQLELFNDRIYAYTLIRGLRRDIADKLSALYKTTRPESRAVKYFEYEYKYGLLKEEQ